MNNINARKRTESDADISRKKLSEANKINNSKPTKNKRRKKYQGVVGWVVISIFILLMGAVIAFFVFRLKGESNLNAEEQFITYEGKKYEYRKEIVNILCLGIDKSVPIAHIEAKRGNIGMADTIMLVSIDTKKHKVKVLAIPRDVMAEVQQTIEGNVVSEAKLQICMQYAYGMSMQQSNDLTVDAVSKLLYNTQIQRCCAINFEALPILNDAIGGVDVEVLEDIEEWVPELVYGETIHLEGDLAMRFVQTRNRNIVEGAALRTQRQKQYAVAFVQKAKSVIKTDPALPLTIFRELQKDGNMCTDITAEDITYLMPEILRISFSDDMIQMLPGECVVGEDGHTEYRMDVDLVKQIVIDTFYKEVQ